MCITVGSKYRLSTVNAIFDYDNGWSKFLHHNFPSDCDDGLKPCQRKVSFYIPKASILNTNESQPNKFQDYVSSGEHPKQYFDIGVLNMQTVFASEERG